MHRLEGPHPGRSGGYGRFEAEQANHYLIDNRCVVPIRICGRAGLAATAAAAVLSLATTNGQQLLDRVVARVGGTAITLTDVRAAVGLGVVRDATDEPAAVQALIDRQLALLEVARFPPPEPAPAAVDARLEAMKARAGDNLERLTRETGMDEQRMRDMARDTLRIQAYVDQRFGTSVQVTEGDVRRYYDDHPREFTANGALVPFDRAEPEARRRASDERLRATVEQWLKDLRARTDVVVLPPLQEAGGSRQETGDRKQEAGSRK